MPFIIFLSICITFFCSFVPFPTLKFNMTKTSLCCPCLAHSISVHCYCPNSSDHRWFNRKTTQVWNSNLQVQYQDWHIGLKLNKCHFCRCHLLSQFFLVVQILILAVQIILQFPKKNLDVQKKIWSSKNFFHHFFIWNWCFWIIKNFFGCPNFFLDDQIFLDDQNKNWESRWHRH